MPSVGAKRAAPWLGGAALLVAIIAFWHYAPAREWLAQFEGWITGLGALGVVIFALAYIVLVVVMAPAELMSIAAGLIFGLWGIPLVIVSATIGAIFAFLIGRYLLRTKVRKLTQRRDLFKAVDAAVGEEGWRLVALLRLNPLVPFNLQNYFFGATDIATLPYAAATFFGIMPGAAAFVYFGTLGQAAAGTTGLGTVRIALLVIGLVATLGLVAVVAWRAKRKLRELGIAST